MIKKKNYIYKIIILITVSLLSNNLSYAQEYRGVQVNVIIDGKPMQLYDQSHALIIGISDYNAGWPALPGVKADLEAVEKVLLNQGFNVIVLENATKVQIDKAISDFISQYGQGVDNRLLIYFAGHGHTVKASYGDELGYIVTVDAPNPNIDPAGFQAKAIEMADFEKYAKRIQSKHALFLFDACFSGSLFALTRAAPEIISYKTSQPVRQFITSGSADESVPDVSVFRRQFVTAISTNEADANKDGYVTGTELGDFIQTTVVNYSYNTQHPQYGKIRNPNLDKGDFVFVLAGASSDVFKNPVTKNNNNVNNNSAVDEMNSASYSETAFGLNLKMIRIKGDTFTMGSSDGENDRQADEVLHQAILSDFYIGETEVTQRQWIAVMGANPSSNNTCDNCPVENVSWNDIQEFLNILNNQTGKQYCLPTEVQWEYAARAGTNTVFNTGNCLSAAQANYDGNYPYDDCVVGPYSERTSAVGSYKPNAWGLYDMHGNVWEWCSDWYGQYPGDFELDYAGASSGSGRVQRGGGWCFFAKYCRVANRNFDAPAKRNDYTGFRLCRVK